MLSFKPMYDLFLNPNQAAFSWNLVTAHKINSIPTVWLFRLTFEHLTRQFVLFLLLTWQQRLYFEGLARLCIEHLGCINQITKSDFELSEQSLDQLEQWVSLTHFMAIQPIAVELFQCRYKMRQHWLIYISEVNFEMFVKFLGNQPNCVENINNPLKGCVCQNLKPPHIINSSEWHTY